MHLLPVRRFSILSDPDYESRAGSWSRASPLLGAYDASADIHSLPLPTVSVLDSSYCLVSTDPVK